MKTYQSAFLFLLFFTFLTGCGNEEFGTGGQSSNSTASPLTSYSHQSCSNFTLIKPKVDVVYVVDNSASTYFLASDIKNALKNTVDTLSSAFDYRVIGTPLIATSGGDNDYQVMTNSTDLAGLPSAPRRIQSSSEFTFFANPAGGGYERGLNRVYSFVNTHRGSLLRTNAYTLIVLISNGRDADIEAQGSFGNGETTYNSSAFNSALSNLRSVKNSLMAQQFRLVSVTAYTSCKPGWFSSQKSYVQMAKTLYQESGASDQDSDSSPDAYDLCGSGFSSIFSSVNNSIQQVLINHGYRFWPITFAENNESVDINEIQVTRISSNGSRTNLVKNTDWTYLDYGSARSENTRETPTPGEPVYGRHFVRFNSLLTYPDCVLVTSVSRTEYYEWVVLPKKPLLPVTVKINGATVPQTALDTSGVMTSVSRNVKAAYPSAGDQLPPVIKSGYMIRITNPTYYYKSGDNVEALYTPAGI